MIKRFSVLLLALASLAGVVDTGAGAQDLGPVATGVSEALSSKAGAGQIPKGTQCFPVGCDTDAEGGSIPSAGVTPSAENYDILLWNQRRCALLKQRWWGRLQDGVLPVLAMLTPRYSFNIKGDFSSLGPFAPGTSNLVWFERATSKYGQWVDVNGGAKTFYTPQPGSRGAGWWAMSSTCYFVYSGLTSSVGSHHNYVCKTI